MDQAIRSSIGRFKLESLLTGSGLGTLYLAYDPLFDDKVVVKVLRTYFEQEQALYGQFTHEVEEVQKLDHPGIAKVRGMGVEDNLRWFAMSYYPEGSLKERLKEPLSVPEVTKIVGELADALDEVHARGILHRDIKPSNVFFGSAGKAVLSDFGMATLGEGLHPLLKTGLTTPLPTYMSYEQAMGLVLDRRTDVYSLAVLTYEMLTKDVPFYAIEPVSLSLKQTSGPPIPPSQINPRVPKRVEEVILRALEPMAAKRPATAGEFARQLQAAANEVVVGSRPPFAVSGLRPAVAGQVIIRGRVVCPSCGQGNPQGNMYCSDCWARLDQAASTTAEEEQVHKEVVRKRNKRRRIRSIAIPSAIGLLAVAVIAIAIVNWDRPLPAASTLIDSASAPGDWAMFQQDPTHDASSSTDVSAFKGEAQWTFHSAAPLSTSPAYVDGVLYLASGDRRIVALDGRTGQLIWESPTTGPVDSSPAIAGNTLYVGLRDGRLIALDTRTGKLRWDYETHNPIYSSPVVKDGVVYVGSGDGLVYALDAQKGTLRFSFDTGGWVMSSPAISNNIVAVATTNRRVFLIDARTGKTRLDYMVGRSVSGSPLISGDKVYIGGEDGSVRALSLTARTPFMEKAILTVWTQLYIWDMAPVPNTQVGMVWLSKLGGSVYSGLAMSDGKLYVGAEDGTLYTLDASDGKQGWTFHAGRAVYAAPVVSGGSVLVTSLDGKLYAIDAKTGKKLWEFATTDRTNSSVIVAGGSVFLASEDGNLYSIR